MTICKQCGQIDMLDGPKICLECKIKNKKAEEARKKKGKKDDSTNDTRKRFFIWKWYDFIRNAF